jgi:hypothetical protein
VHGMLARTATLLEEVDKRIRALITLAYAVCADETPLRAGAATPRPGRKKAEKYLLVACTDLYTSYLVGDRDLDTFRTSVIAERDGAVLVHDRYRGKHSASALTWCFARVIGPGRICCGAGVVVGQAGAGSGGIQGWSRMASRRACSAL